MFWNLSLEGPDDDIAISDFHPLMTLTYDYMAGAFLRVSPSDIELVFIRDIRKLILDYNQTHPRTHALVNATAYRVKISLPNGMSLKNTLSSTRQL